jgi:hypothetical protein
MNAPDGLQLIDDLLAEPQRFDEGTRGYDLLQFYLGGQLSVDTLRDLLQHKSVFVQRTAAFIASELGYRARSLVDDVVPLVRSKDRHIANYAMEVLTVCARLEHSAKFVHVVRTLESPDNGLRSLAMALVTNADVSQLEAAAHAFDNSNPHDRSHKQGLAVLLGGSDVSTEVAAKMMLHDDPILRSYGAIAMKRLQKQNPSLHIDIESVSDPTLRRYFEY